MPQHQPLHPHANRRCLPAFLHPAAGHTRHTEGVHGLYQGLGEGEGACDGQKEVPEGGVYEGEDGVESVDFLTQVDGEGLVGASGKLPNGFFDCFWLEGLWELGGERGRGGDEGRGRGICVDW